MEITKENVDELNALLKVHVAPEDYQEKVDNVLKDYKKKASIKGFRPGKVPMGMIKKMVGPKVLIDEVNKLVYESISNYLKEEDVHILGEPLINEEKQDKIDWENQSEFDFIFDLGLAPEINMSLSEKDKIPYHLIKVDKEIVDEYVKEYTNRFGQFENTDQIVSGEEMIKGDLTELNDDESPKEDGIQTSNSTLSMAVLKDENIKEQFINAKTGDEIIFDLKAAYPNDSELSSLLSIEKEKVANLNPKFKVKINEILKFVEAEVNQAFFDKIFGENEVNDEKEFREKLAEEIKKSLRSDSEYKFAQDVKSSLIEKANIELPVEFLKRWLLASNQEQFTEEQIDEQFDQYEDDLKWQIIKNHIIKNHDIQVSEEEIREYAKMFAQMQFQQYGLMNTTDEQLEQFAQTMLEKDEDRRRMYDKKFEDKIIDFVKDTVTVNEKEISRDKFKKMLEK